MLKLVAFVSAVSVVATASAAPSDAFRKLLSALDSYRSGSPSQIAPSVSLSANQKVITSGEYFTLAWTSLLTSSCEAAGGWTGSLATSGSLRQQAYGIGERTYSIRCDGDNGEVTSGSVTVSFQPSTQQQKLQADVAAIFSTL